MTSGISIQLLTTQQPLFAVPDGISASVYATAPSVSTWELLHSLLHLPTYIFFLSRIAFQTPFRYSYSCCKCDMSRARRTEYFHLEFSPHSLLLGCSQFLFDHVFPILPPWQQSSLFSILWSHSTLLILLVEHIIFFYCNTAIDIWQIIINCRKKQMDVVFVFVSPARWLAYFQQG